MPKREFTQRSFQFTLRRPRGLATYHDRSYRQPRRRSHPAAVVSLVQHDIMARDASEQAIQVIMTLLVVTASDVQMDLEAEMILPLAHRRYGLEVASYISLQTVCTTSSKQKRFDMLAPFTTFRNIVSCSSAKQHSPALERSYSLAKFCICLAALHLQECICLPTCSACPAGKFSNAGVTLPQAPIS